MNGRTTDWDTRFLVPCDLSPGDCAFLNETDGERLLGLRPLSALEDARLK